MANTVAVKIERRNPGRSQAPLLPVFHVTMERVGENPGVWEEICYGEDQLRLCLNFFQAGVSLSGGGHVNLPEIPR